MEWKGAITVQTSIFVVDRTILRIMDGGSSTAAADGGGFSRFFIVSDASLQWHVTNMTFQNGRARFGGVIAAKGSTPIFIAPARAFV